MQNFQGIVFIRIRTYKEIFKTALVYLQFLFLAATGDVLQKKCS